MFAAVGVSPEVALLIAGFAVIGLLLELAVPGVGVGAVVALVLGGAAVWVLADRDATGGGLALLSFATVLLVVGVFVRRWSALAVAGGVVWLVAGSMLFDDGPAWQVVVASAVLLSAATVTLGNLVGRTRGAPAWSGQAGSLRGQFGEVRQGGAAGQPLQVLVAGALWSASADTATIRGMRVVVTGQLGLQLRVAAADDNEGQWHGET